MIPTRAASQLTRVVSLSFRLTGIAEESEQVRQLMSNIQRIISLLAAANMAYRGLTAVMASNPFGLVLLGLSALTGVAVAQSGLASTEFEEYRARSPT